MFPLLFGQKSSQGHNFSVDLLLRHGHIFTIRQSHEYRPSKGPGLTTIDVANCRALVEELFQGRQGRDWNSVGRRCSRGVPLRTAAAIISYSLMFPSIVCLPRRSPPLRCHSPARPAPAFHAIPRDSGLRTINLAHEVIHSLLFNPCFVLPGKKYNIVGSDGPMKATVTCFR